MDNANQDNCCVVGMERKDKSVLTEISIKRLEPGFLNPVKWCDRKKLLLYKQLIEEGVQFPPIEVCIREKNKLEIWDGHHRWFASYLAGKKKILAWVYD